MCFNCACYASNGHLPSLAVRQTICFNPTQFYTGVIGGVPYTFPPLPAALLAPRAGHHAPPPAGHLVVHRAGHHAPPPAGLLVVHHAGHPVVPHAGHLVVPHAGHLVVHRAGHHAPPPAVHHVHHRAAPLVLHPVVDMSTYTDPQGVVRFCKGRWRKSLCFHGKKCNRVCISCMCPICDQVRHRLLLLNRVSARMSS